VSHYQWKPLSLKSYCYIISIISNIFFWRRLILPPKAHTTGCFMLVSPLHPRSDSRTTYHAQTGMAFTVLTHHRPPATHSPLGRESASFRASQKPWAPEISTSSPTPSASTSRITTSFRTRTQSTATTSPPSPPRSPSPTSGKPPSASSAPSSTPTTSAGTTTPRSTRAHPCVTGSFS
jgi:hypothetical protein